MITVKFLVSDGRYKSFIAEGHADEVTCAGVTAVCMFAINTITEFLAADAKVKVVPDRAAGLYLQEEHEVASAVLESLSAHLDAMIENGAAIDIITRRVWSPSDNAL